MVRALRIVLAFVFVSIAAGCLYWFAVMPYESVATTTHRAEPTGAGFFIAAIICGAFTLAAAFLGDWE